jgi:hypothetical protein
MLYASLLKIIFERKWLKDKIKLYYNHECTYS